jgi:hypothetical protein
MTERADGISALALQQELCLTSYKTAWSILQKLRAAMKPSLRGRLRGRIEVASYGIGGSEPTRRFTIAIGTEIRSAGERLVRIARLPDDSADGHARFVCDAIESGAQVHTTQIGDEQLHALGYRQVEPLSFPYMLPEFEAALLAHEMGGELTKDQADAYFRARDPNSRIIEATKIDSVRRLSRRLPNLYAELEVWLRDTHQGAGAIKPEHLDAYLNEFAFRVSFRIPHRPGLLFIKLLKAALKTPPARYRPSRRR